MIDVSPEHIERIIEEAWHPDTVEFYNFENEFYRLDFSKEEDARYAINKWLSIDKWHSIESMLQHKEDLRYCITKKKYPLGNVDLNNLDGDATHVQKPNISNEYWDSWGAWDSWDKNFFNFLLILWDEWFHEPFIPANLSQYRERIDREFVEFPHMPELWGKPKYKVGA
ncbi:hypothetical protein [Acinetobacter nosocomialis]|uniref:hypothetical protein n=1 Tax=Acinetobacter nosocomialis TaxID=106654 RepID=UPI001F1DB91F|nr:hypothetical protein [Acinetobacter nosocomialis]MCE7531223.1 hypothetical protein [Acinetobacter nosocomialis]